MLTKRQADAIKYFVHTPEQGIAKLHQLAQKIREGGGVTIGSPLLDRNIVSTIPGFVRTWVASPGNGKSTILRAIAKHNALNLVNTGQDDKKYVAIITYEEPIEVQELYLMTRQFSNTDFWRGKIEPNKIVEGFSDRVTLPIYTIGESIGLELNTPRMTIDVVMDAIEGIKAESGLEPAVILIDYAQEIQVNDEDDNRTKNIIQGMRDVLGMAVRLGCPVEIAVQASREALQNKPYPIPQAHQMEWANFLFQKPGVVVSTWRVATSHQNETTIPYYDFQNQEHQIPNHPHLTIFKVLKHRPGAIAKGMPVRLNPDTLQFSDDIGLRGGVVWDAM